MYILLSFPKASDFFEFSPEMVTEIFIKKWKVRKNLQIYTTSPTNNQQPSGTSPLLINNT
jgi:hypothetical protein